MAFVMHGTTNRKMATMKMLITPSLTCIPNSCCASAPVTRDRARHAERAPGAPEAAWLNSLFGRTERARVAQPRNAQPGRRRLSAAGVGVGSACAPVSGRGIVARYVCEFITVCITAVPTICVLLQFVLVVGYQYILKRQKILTDRNLLILPSAKMDLQ
jgi:hypothetical protein